MSTTQPAGPTCVGVLLIRLKDRCILAEAFATATSDPLLWSDAVTKAASPVAIAAGVVRSTHDSSDGRFTTFIFSDAVAGFGVAAVFAAGVSRRHGFLLCDSVGDLFKKMFVENIAQLTPAACHSMEAPMLELVQQFGDPLLSDDRVSRVKKAVTEVKALALDNVERVLQRGERIETIVEATNELHQSAEGFHRSSETLRKKMWWNDMKGRLIIGGVCVAFLFFVYLIFCGGSLSCAAEGSAGAPSASVTTAAGIVSTTSDVSSLPPFASTSANQALPPLSPHT